MRIEIHSSAFDPHEALRRFCADEKQAGACASFIGLCRGEAAGRFVHWLELEHYPGFTEQEIASVADVTITRHKLIDLIVLHRTGRVMPGEAIVFVAALSAHRAAALAAVEQLMDYLKTDAPFWKREKRDDGAHWIEPSPEDRRRRAALGGSES